jgi:hypothetical protein
MTDTEYLTPHEVAKILRIHPTTVIQRFAKYPGVIDVAPEKPVYGKRSHRTLRIPRSALNRFIEEKQVR